jgi:hypothetical protein
MDSLNPSHLLNLLGAMLQEMSPYILLGFLFAGALHAFVRPDLMTQHLSGRGWRPALKAALLGVPLPLCSCGVLPTAISLRRNGASTSATTAFLISTPQTGVDSIAATYSLLGPAFALMRPLAAFLSAVAGGTLMGRLSRTEDAPSDASAVRLSEATLRPTLGGRLVEMLRYGLIDMVASVGRWLVVGLLVAALITALVPDDFFLRFADRPLLAMLAVVLIAVPMYVCATGSIPIALSLILKGLTPGTAFVFLMAGPAVNFASYTLLSRALGRRDTLLYIAFIAGSAVGVGLIIDYLLPAAWFVPHLTQAHACCALSHSSAFNSACALLLSALLIYALIIKRFIHKPTSQTMTTEYRIEGMMCAHCQARVEKELSTLPGVTSVAVDLGRKVARVEGTATEQEIAAKVTALGYEFGGSV